MTNMDEKEVIAETQEEITEEVQEETPQTEEIQETDQEENLEAPNERTKQQFEKLKDSNQNLKKERDQYKNVLDSLYPSDYYTQPVNQAPQANQYQNLDQNQIDDAFNSMVDENGYMDGNKLKEVLDNLNKRASTAEENTTKVLKQLENERVAREQQQKTTLMQQVHEQYPQADPESPEFDPNFHEVMRNDLIGQMMAGQEDPMKAAQKAHNLLYSNMNKQQKEIKEQKEEQKAQINATGRPKSSTMEGYYAKEEESVLRDKMRQGAKGAVAEALRRRGL